MGRSPEAHMNRGTWTQEEDQILLNYIARHGQGCWRSLPKAAGLLRCGKSCRLRWTNYLRPDLKRGNFSRQEEDIIIKLHTVLGNKWSLIAGRLPGRTDNEIKNYWNTHISRKLIARGINPQTHHPFDTANNNSLSLDLRSPTPSSSGTTEETQPYSQLQHEQNAIVAANLDLELNIGPPSSSTRVPGQLCWPVARPPQHAPAKGVCLCWKLGLHQDGDCVVAKPKRVYRDVIDHSP